MRRFVLSSKRRRARFGKARNDGMKNFVVPRPELYVCGKCGTKVAGGRYNDHCPKCLWSKHVDDKVPGDRASTCFGSMEPVGVEIRHSRNRLVEKCKKCDKTFIVDCAENDNVDLVIELSQRPVSRETNRTGFRSRRGDTKRKYPDR